MGGEILSEALTWAEIDLAAYRHNIAELRRATRPDAKFMAVVKANGYGHGAVEVSQAALESGADWLGVARLHEAVELREAGIEAPILIFGLTPAEETDTLLDLDLTQAVFTARRPRPWQRRPLERQASSGSTSRSIPGWADSAC